MQLLILIAVGYITGILWGLYLKVSIVPIIFLLGFGLVFRKNIKVIEKYKWHIAIFMIVVVISNIRINILENKFNNLYKDLEKVDVVRGNYK